MTRFRRRSLKRGETVAAALASAVLGLGTAAVAYYVTRLLLSRESFAEPDGSGPPKLEPGTPAEKLPAPRADAHDGSGSRP